MAYAVETILETRVDETTGETLRLVKWVGFPESENTWEPDSSFAADQDRPALPARPTLAADDPGNQPLLPQLHVRSDDVVAAVHRFCASGMPRMVAFQHVAEEFQCTPGRVTSIYYKHTKKQESKTNPYAMYATSAPTALPPEFADLRLPGAPALAMTTVRLVHMVCSLDPYLMSHTVVFCGSILTHL
jgi:hypothetical protein